jgi:hypothetical protein
MLPVLEKEFKEMEKRGFFYYQVFDLTGSNGDKKIISTAFEDEVLDLQAEMNGL